MELSDKKFAVLIDADNISHRKIKDILDEIANYGTPTIKRIYGDFTDPKFAAWKSVLLENSITPIQQYAYTTGKNATDSALIIDAMDILHKESVNGFCIVSSDSDYTRLASRIRESGREVLGFGEKKTPKPFIKSCDKFIYVEILGQPAPAPTTAVTPATAPAAKAAAPKKPAKKHQGAMHPKQTCRKQPSRNTLLRRQPPQNPPLRRRRPPRLRIRHSPSRSFVRSTRISKHCSQTRSKTPPTTAAGPSSESWAGYSPRRCRISTPAITGTKNCRCW